MYIIVVYDICVIEEKGNRRLNKTMKIFRKYLHHTQKSVFEGEISMAKLGRLQREIEMIINHSVDSVIFFRIDNKNNMKKEVIGLQYDSTSQYI